MWRLPLIISLIAIAAAAAARWYFGLRVLTGVGGRPCRCDPARWDDATDLPAEASALEFGRRLRQQALAQWTLDQPKAAASRQSVKRFGLAVPPLAAIVAVFAFIVAKIPVLGAIAIALFATALACAVGLSSLPAELAAVTRASRALRESRCFKRRDDEDAVIRCAHAHAWMDTLPHVVSTFQRLH